MTLKTMPVVVLSGALWCSALWSTSAAACDGKPGESDANCAPREAEEEEPDPSLCARRPDLIGRENCAWTTTMMAQQVLEEGVPWSYVGHLVPSERVLASKVATPYTVGPDGTIFVIANEVLDGMIRRDGDQGRVQITGRLLEVDGVKYFVATSVTRVRS